MNLRNFAHTFALMAQTPADLIKKLEAVGREADLSVPDLCKRAKIDRATWQRLKAGKNEPRFATYRRLNSLLQKLQPSAEAA